MGEFLEAKRALLFVPRPEDVKQIIGMLQFWGVKEAQNLQETLGIEVETRAQQLERGASDSASARSSSGKSALKGGRSSGAAASKFNKNKPNHNPEDENNEEAYEGSTNTIASGNTSDSDSDNDANTELILRAARSRLGATSRLKDARASPGASSPAHGQGLAPGLDPQSVLSTSGASFGVIRRSH